jgi:hypothetical protein
VGFDRLWFARAAGLKLKEMCVAGPVQVWFRTHVENGWRSVQITVGEIALEKLQSRATS